MLMLVSAAVRVGSCGNFGADQCSISSDCLQCVSSETPEVERCFQLRLLILGSTNHPMERELYCTGHCPIILATAYYYCRISAVEFLFNECSVYTVEPTGEGGFSDLSRTCSNNFRRCDQCLHSRNNDALRCLQHQLLVDNTNNTSYRSSFCESDCPLTLTTSNWYCDQSTGLGGPFAECSMNENGRFCSEISNEVMTDTDVMQCRQSPIDCRSSECVAAINKYGCCLGVLSSSTAIGSSCELEDCTVETGGGHTQLATPLIIILMMVTSAVAVAVLH